LVSVWDFLVLVVLEYDSVDGSFGVAWSSLPFAVAVGGLVALPFPASCFLYVDEAVEAGVFCSVECQGRVWH